MDLDDDDDDDSGTMDIFDAAPPQAKHPSKFEMLVVWKWFNFLIS